MPTVTVGLAYHVTTVCTIRATLTQQEVRRVFTTPALLTERRLMIATIRIHLSTPRHPEPAVVSMTIAMAVLMTCPKAKVNVDHHLLDVNDNTRVS